MSDGWTDGRTDGWMGGSMDGMVSTGHRSYESTFGANDDHGDIELRRGL